MKKILSVLIAVLMSVSVLTVAAMPAMASVSSPSPVVIDENAKPTVEVNGQVTETDVTYSPDPNDATTITFVYTGDGELTGWEDNLEELGLVEGVDYTAVVNPDGSYTIKLISDEAIIAWNEGKIVVNALVNFPETTQPAKKDDSKKSPKTGASAMMLAGGFAAAGAGFAVITASRKKNDEE